MTTRNIQRGISLIEIMVAMAIGLFILLLVTVVYLTGGRNLNFRQGQGENLANSRYTLDTLSSQLAKTGYRRNPMELMAEAFPADNYLGCDFKRREALKVLSDGSLCIRYQQRDVHERDCSGGDPGDISDLLPYEGRTEPADLQGSARRGMYVEKYWVTPEHQLVCNDSTNVVADGVQAIRFEFGVGPARAVEQKEKDEHRRVDAYITTPPDPAKQAVRSLRYAVLLATANERVTGGIASDVCTRWTAAGGDGSLCDTSGGRLYQLAASALTLRNLMP